MDARQVGIEKMVLSVAELSPQIARPRTGVDDRERLLQLPVVVLEAVRGHPISIQHQHACRIAVDDRNIQNELRLRPQWKFCGAPSPRLRVRRTSGADRGSGNHDDRRRILPPWANFGDPDIASARSSERRLAPLAAACSARDETRAQNRQLSQKIAPDVVLRRGGRLRARRRRFRTSSHRLRGPVADTILPASCSSAAAQFCASAGAATSSGRERKDQNAGAGSEKEWREHVRDARIISCTLHGSDFAPGTVWVRLGPQISAAPKKH